jgi:hypothetical protein
MIDHVEVVIQPFRDLMISQIIAKEFHIPAFNEFTEPGIMLVVMEVIHQGQPVRWIFRQGFGEGETQEASAACDQYL